MDTQQGDDGLLDRGVTCALEAMTIEAQSILNTRNAVQANLYSALSLLWNIPGKVVVSGLGKSGHIGAKIAATLASTGTPSFFVHSTEALHGDSGMVTAQDGAILISNSGETVEVCHFAHMLADRGVPMIAMTRDKNSTLARLATVWLSIAVDKEADPLHIAPTSSTTSTLALGDCLAAGLMTMRGFTLSDFAMHHPGGSLGSRLSPQPPSTPPTTIKDLASKGTPTS